MSLLNTIKDTFSEYKATYISVAILLLLAVICYLLAYTNLLLGTEPVDSLVKSVQGAQQSDQPLRDILHPILESAYHQHALQELFLNLSIAFLVAVIIIVTVEIYSRRRTRKDILEYQRAVREDIWRGILGRMVPKPIVDEIEDILKSDVVKEGCRYTIILKPPYDGMPDNRIVVERRLRYEVTNVTGRPASYSVKSFIESEFDNIDTVDDDGQPITIPRHIDLQVDGQEIPLDDCIEPMFGEEGRRLEHEIRLPSGGGSAEVYLRGEEMNPQEDRNSYVQLKPTCGVQLHIHNRAPDIVEVRDVMLQHPNWEEFDESPDGIYRYEGGILPGQAISIAWGPVDG